MENFKYTGTHELETLSDSAKRYNRYLLSLILKQAPVGGKILDIGAGLGYYAERLKAKGYDILCMEIDEFQCRYMEEKGLTVVRSIDDVADGSIDFIYSINVLEHIDDDGAALKIWAGKLRHNTALGEHGELFIWVPAFNVLYSSFDRLVGHFRRYRKQSVIEKITAAGFTVTKARYSDSMGFLVALLFKWLKGRGDPGNARITKTQVVIFDTFIFPLNRITDALCSRMFGKNVWALARRHSPFCNHPH
ncbi:MAG: class I SAM-dependent methyltransferase [Prevotellaceae bacterium]|jgi:SAM-dependent methyltransferase|nr:class I SAM-dependent methyltransferase [Prevotellaceae bacterium]